MTGLVYQSTGSWYKVKLENNKFIEARLSGRLRLTEVKTTNPVAVGDYVEIRSAEGEHDYQIDEVKKRNNYLIRSSPRHPQKTHIIAANVDQSILVVSLRDRRTPLGFIDRYLVSTEMYHIPGIIVFNKKDIYRKKDFEKYNELKKLYESLGYPCFIVSAEQKENIDPLKEILFNKTTLISGQSGVGKSSLLNSLNPEWDILVRQLNKRTSKGQHTTTYATMYDFDNNSKIIDTPGIKLLKLIDLEPNEICHYFPEFRAHTGKCKFDDCVHLNEPECSVLDAFNNGEIAESRMIAYINIYDEIKNKNYWQRDV